jgi:hypothetical protein
MNLDEIVGEIIRPWQRLEFGKVGGIIGGQSRKGSSGKPREYTKWKVVLGLVLLVLSPIRIFSIPNTAEHIGYDFAGIIWWGFVGWLLWSGGLGLKPKSD